MVVQARSSPEESCPYCRGGFERGEPLLVCEACQTSFHADCLRQELGRCSTLGCAGTRALPRAASGSEPVRVQPAAERPRAAPGVWSASRRYAFLLCAAGAAFMAGLVAFELWLQVARSRAPSGSMELVFVGVLVLTAVAIAIHVAPVPEASVARHWQAPVAPVASGSCPVCATALAPGERILACEGCGGRYHPACLRTAGRCAGAGCTGRRAVPGRAGPR